MLLETLFDLGFSVAKADHCHLLFAAWDTSGKSSEKDGKKKQSSLRKSASVIPCQGMKEALLLLGSHIADLTKESANLSTPFETSGLSSDLFDKDNIISDESGEESDGGYPDYDDGKD
eukprot:141709-Ditylum_brightwellii.AAC.2